MSFKSNWTLDEIVMPKDMNDIGKGLNNLVDKDKELENKKFDKTGGRVTGAVNADNVQVDGNNVYHIGRKPTPADIGATPINSGFGDYISKYLIANANIVDGTRMFYLSAVGAGGPVSGRGFLISQIAYDESKTRSQTAYDVIDGEVYYRYMKEGSWQAWSKVYTENSRPTPEEIGAVANTGGAITGELELSATYPIVIKAPTISNSWSRGIWYKNDDKTKNLFGVGILGANENLNSFYVGTGDTPWINTLFKVNNTDAFYKNNKIYHEGKKPTPAEVGASPVGHVHDDRYFTEAEINTKLDLKLDRISGKQLSTNDYSTVEKNKLAGIATGANAYVHPSTHPATIITPDSTHRFVTDAEKNTWNNKISKADYELGESGNIKDISIPETGSISPDIKKIQKSGKYFGMNNVNKPDDTDASFLYDVGISGGLTTGTKVITAITGDGRMYITGGLNDYWDKWTKVYTESQKPTLQEIALSEIKHSTADLNFLEEIGFYSCPLSSTAAALANCPTTQSFSLLVEKHAGTKQTLTEYVTSNARIWYRNKYSGAWGEWIRLYTTASKPTPAEIGASLSGHTHDERYYTEAEVNTKLELKVDKISGKQLSTNDYTAAEKNKLAGIASGANAYTHPGSHPASMIAEDTSHRFATDSEKSRWNSVVSSGSNNSGTWVRFNDGTQICQGVMSMGIVSMTTLSVSPAVYGGQTKEFTFPVAFASIPRVVADVESTGYTNSQCSYVTTTSCSIRMWSNYATDPEKVKLGYIAIGRWK